MTIINTVAKYYQLGRTGDKPLAFLNWIYHQKIGRMAVLIRQIISMETAAMFQRLLPLPTIVRVIWLVRHIMIRFQE
jgi:hypothetical protein